MTKPYTFQGKDITMTMSLVIRAVVDIIKEKENISFEEAIGKFYASHTYQVLRDTENTLWAESPAYIADAYFEKRFAPKEI